MTMKRAVMMAVMVVAVVALTVPMMGVRIRAAGSAANAGVARVAPAVASPAATTVVNQQGTNSGGSTRRPAIAGDAQNQEAEGKISAEVLKALGIRKLAKGADAARIGEQIKRKLLSKKAGSGVTADAETGPPAVGLPEVLNATSALSASLITTIGGRDTQFSEVALIADWDGREDCVADHGAKVDDFSFIEPEIDFSLTRAAISEHTIANGFAENVFYYGDSVGNVWVGVDTTGDGLVEQVLQINLPTVLNAFGSLVSDDQVTITGLAVNPVADLTSFSNVNGAYNEFAGQTGEILYVTYMDTEGLRLAAGNQLVRSGLLAFPVADVVSVAAAPPSPISDVGFPVTVGAAFGVAFSVFSNVAGCSVDDDGSVYFQQVDLIQFTGGNIVKVTDVGANQDRSAATNGFLTLTTLDPAGRVYGTASGCAPPCGPADQVNRFTNYSGTSTLFGNIVSLANGYGNVLYAAVSRSLVATDDQFTQLTEGRFAAPGAFTAGTPSMIISFADCSGGFDACSGEATGGVDTTVAGTLPVGDGLADASTGGGTGTAGVSNFRIFVQGNGPDLAPAAGGTAVVPGTPTGLLKIDMQIDFTAHSGLAVSEEGTVFVISGGTPAGIGTNPSALLGEVLCFEDMCPMDRRADPVDLRGNAFPNPPASGGNAGDGDSDRFDHIFFQAPIDQVTLTPTGLAGLARGFLRYTNRLAPVPIGPGVTLGSTVRMLGDDATTEASVIFEAFDPGHQVAGGDDQNTPFRGDDDNGAGTPPLVGPLSGGFEFVFGGPVGTAGCVWNGTFLNSNGSVSFGEGDTNNIATVPAFRQGPPKIAPAWTDLNPSSRAGGFLNTFPVQALGFANINAFKVRWINVPEFGQEECGSRNTFAVTLYDDGTGIDENANQPLNPANPIGNNAVPFDLQEGPTDQRFTREPNTQVLVGCSPRPAASGIFLFEYARMDLLGTDARAVIAGYSIGNLSPLNPPGLCETNLSEAARAAETAFGVIQGQTAAIGCNCLLGEGTEPTIFELFNEGRDASIGSGGEVTFATPDFDLRFEGNDAAACTSSRQRDFNRGKVGFLGIGCAPPANPICSVVNVPTFATTPSTTGLVNSLCAVQLNIVGCGFFPNETTTICQGFEAETGQPLQRPGKTVTTAATLACDTNGDGVAESVVALVSVTPVSCNLVRATIPVSASFGATSTSGFPAACCGGAGTVTVTTTFSSGDNNIFGPFTRTAVCSLALGTRAPIVFSVTPSDGNCAVVPQDLLISGACFIIPQGSITSVFAIDRANPATRINAVAFQVLNNNLIDADFNFGSANAGKTFLIFVQGPGGISRNITTAVAGSPAGCPLGNEQGIQVTFTCSTQTTPGPTPGSDIAVLTSCDLKRNIVSGVFTLDIIGTNIKLGATVTINGVSPKKIKFRDLVPATQTFNKIVVVKKTCSLLNGAASIVVTNPGTAGGPSAPLLCTERCPTN